MEPRIQYAKTSDGVSIAFWTIGSGAALVFLRGEGISHIGLELSVPELRSFYERLAEGRKFIRYDHRGCGLSMREVTDFSHESLMLDLLAVLDAAGCESADLLTLGAATHLGLIFAASHPERVNRLLLLLTAGRPSEAPVARQLLMRAIAEVAEEAWEDYNQIVAHLAVGWSNAELARHLASLSQQAATPQHAQEVREREATFDRDPLLPRVSVPTLVISSSGLPSAARLASQIPDAQIAVVPEENYLLHWPVVAYAIESFLEKSRREAASAAGRPTGALVTVLFTDVEGSTALTQRLGDDKARDVLREHERIVREALGEHGGTEVKTMGDGFMASFGSVTKAVECAIALQRACEESNAGAAEPLHVRVGLNAGEPVEEHGDLFGATVILASRIAAKAEGGEILASDVVRGLCSGKGFLFADRGEFVAKGFEDPVRLYGVRWEEGK